MRMRKQQRDELRAAVQGALSTHGGYNELRMSALLAESILMLDESNEESAKVNSRLTIANLVLGIALLLVGINQGHTHGARSLATNQVMHIPLRLLHSAKDQISYLQGA